MGLVFDSEKVAAGEIPADENGQSQYDAALLLGEALHEQAALQPEAGTDLVAYMMYGSAALKYRPTATRRSDIDLLVILDEASEPSPVREAVADRIAAIEQALNVEVGAVTYTKAALENGMRVNPFYARHLDSMHGIPCNPVHQYFSPVFYHDGLAEPLFGRVPFVDAWPFAIKYLEARRGLLQAQLDQAEPDVTFLKGPFELPRNLGRTFADLFHQYICEHTDSYNPELDVIDTPVDDNLPHWLKLLRIAELTETVGLIGTDVERLNELDGAYTDLLEATAKGDASIRQYEAWLKSVYTEALERAFKIVTVADAIVYRTVELAKLDSTYDKVRFDDASLAGYSNDSLAHRKELTEKRHRAGQITPVEYDVDQLLFRLAPKYPDIAARYKKTGHRVIQADEDFMLQMAWLDSKRKTRAFI